MRLKHLLLLTSAVALLKINAYELNPKIDLSLAPAAIKCSVEYDLNSINIKAQNQKLYKKNLAVPFALNVSSFNKSIEKFSNFSKIKTIKVKEFYLAQN